MVDGMKIVQEDGVQYTFIKSKLNDKMCHVIMEFITLDDYDYNYLSIEDVEEIYKVKL